MPSRIFRCRKRRGFGERQRAIRQYENNAFIVRVARQLRRRQDQPERRRGDITDAWRALTEG